VKWILLMAALVIADPFSRLVEAGVAAWTPPPRVARSEWCEQNLRLPEKTSARPGRFDLTERPYFREPLDAIDDPAVRELVLCIAPQAGKTTLLHAMVASQGAIAAAPMMFAGPDQVYCREERDKIYGLCEASPALRAAVPPKRVRNDRFIDLDHCLCYLAWSGSSQRLSGRACKLVLCSEVDRWQESLELAKQRTAALYQWCIVYEGSPREASQWIWPLYKDSDRRTWRVPCPHCGAYQQLRLFVHKSGPNAGRGGLGGLQDGDGRWRTPEQARLAAYYLCEVGDCRIESIEKNQVVRAGRWAPEGCGVAADGSLTGTPLVAGRRRGYQLNRLYTPTVSFGDAAEAYLLLRNTTSGMQSIFNDWLALPHEPRGLVPRWKDLGRRLAGGYPRGVVPRGAYFLTAAGDMQARGIWWLVRAWGDQKTSWLVDWGFVPRLETPSGVSDHPNVDLASDLRQFDARVVRYRWPVDGQNPSGFSALAAARIGLDRGGRPADVDAFVRAHPGERVMAVFGNPRLVPGALWRPTPVEIDPTTGKGFAGSLIAWGLDTQAYKTEIADRWFADRRLPGAWWLPCDILHQPDGEEYLRQITAETRVVKKGRHVWELPSHDKPNHYWDCCVYSMALADMVTGLVWDAAQWPWAQPAAQAAPSKPPREEPPREYLAAR